MPNCNFNYGQSTDLRTNEEKLTAFRNHVLDSTVFVPMQLNIADLPNVWNPDEEFFNKMKQKK